MKLAFPMDSMCSQRLLDCGTGPAGDPSTPRFAVALRRYSQPITLIAPIWKFLWIIAMLGWAFHSFSI